MGVFSFCVELCSIYSIKHILPKYTLFHMISLCNTTQKIANVGGRPLYMTINASPALSYHDASPCLLLPSSTYLSLFKQHFPHGNTGDVLWCNGLLVSITYTHASSQYICTMGTHVLY